MSLERHPNFHACKFVTDIVCSYYDSLRGEADRGNGYHPDIHNEIMEFVEKVENKVDEHVLARKRAEHGIPP